MTKDIISEVYNKDCIAGMKEYPDKYFDLAIVDIEYGIEPYPKGENKKYELGTFIEPIVINTNAS